jgi:hypothetical protein
MSVTVTVTRKQGSTMGTVIAKVTDPGNVVRDVNFYVRVLDRVSAELGPYPADILRRPLPGVYEKDVILDPLLETSVRTEVMQDDGTSVANIPVQTFGLRSGTVGGTGEVRVQDLDTGPTAAGTLVFQGKVVSVDGSGVATFNLDSRYPQIEHTHPYLPLAGGLLTGMLQVQRNTVNPGYDSGHVELRTTDGSAVALGFHRAGFTALALRHSSAGALDLLDQGGAWAQYRGSSFVATASRYYAGDGAFLALSNGSAQFLTSGGTALQARVGGLLVSDAYAHAPYVPANGIWSRGDIISAGSISAAGGKLSTGGVAAGITVNARQANTPGWEIYNNGGTLGWYSGQYSADTMTLTQGGLLTVAALTARYEVTVQGGMRFANGGYLQANRADGTAEGVFWPRWTDNNTYLNYGGGGYFFIRDSANGVRMVFDPNGAGFTTWIQARGVGYDLRLGGGRSGAHSQVTSTPNLHLDCTDGWQTYINYYNGRPTNIGGIDQSTYKLAVNGDAILHNNGWFRNANGGVGIYNEALNRHLYAGADSLNNGWNITGGLGETFLALRDSYGSAPRGWLFSNPDGFGLLHSGRGWAVRTWHGGTMLYGSSLTDQDGNQLAAIKTVTQAPGTGTAARVGTLYVLVA